MCFDCRESALMSLKERWMGEMESRMLYVPGPSQDALIGYKVRGCRCSTPLQQRPAISICPGCEGIKAERRLEALNTTGHSDMNRTGDKKTTREEHTNDRHDLGTVKASEPQYQNVKAAIGIFSKEKSGISVEAQEQHIQERNARAGQQGLEEVAVSVAGDGFNSKQGAFNTPKPQLRADDVDIRPQGNQKVSVRASESDPEYEPGAIEDDESSSSGSTPS